MSLALAGILVTTCLTGCSKDTALEGSWEDNTGYAIQFNSDGTFVESDYGRPLQYTYTQDGIMYTWPDGYLRSASVNFTPTGQLSLRINGFERTFSPSKLKVRSEGWNADELNPSCQTSAKFVLSTSLPIQSELRLLADKSYSFSWGAELPEFWHKAGDNIKLGMYADCGAGEALILYSPDATVYDLMIESSAGSYLGALPLSGEVHNIEADFSSPVNWRGYTMAGTVEDEAANIKYVFSSDNSMTKIGDDGTELAYAYFIDREGLINLYCIDGMLDTDYMWLDTEGEVVYRMVFKRDSWTDYMYDIAQTDKLSAVASSTTEESIADKEVRFKAQDYEQIKSDGIVLDNLFGERGNIVDAMYKDISNIEYKEFLTDVESVKNQSATLSGSLEEQRQLEEQREEQKQKFLDEMAGLAEERKLKEQEAADEFGSEMEALGYKYDSSTDTWYIPGSVDYYPDGYTPDGNENFVQIPPSNGDITANFGTPATPPSTPTVSGTISNYSSATVTFACNCVLCRTEHTPVEEGKDNVVLADTSVWEEGTKLLIGSNGNIDVTVVDGKGAVQGKNLTVYSTDHAWVNSQHAGIYTVREVKS